MSASDGLVKKQNTTSAVWTYFGFEPDQEGRPKDDSKPVCKLCLDKGTTRVVATKGANTSNLLSHLKTTHPSVYVQVKPAASNGPSTSSLAKRTGGQQSLAASFSKGTLYARGSKKWQTLTTAVTHCIAKEMMPLSVIDKSAFREMLKAFDPQYEPPSRKYLSGTAIPAMYEQTRSSVATEVQGAAYFSATTDLWSSSASQPYLSYTLHFINGDWKLCTKCLQTVFCPEDHTGENLAECLQDTLLSWGLDVSKQVCLTTDCGSNIISAVRRLDWTHLPCFGHILHNAIGNATKDARTVRALAVAKKVVSTFSRSWKKKRDMAKAQDTLNLKKHSLVADCPTRWGSQQKMVERILEQETAIRQVLGADRRTSHLIPSWQDIDVLESLNKALAPLKDFTDILSAEGYVTVSTVKPVLHHLTTVVLMPLEEDTHLTKDIKKGVLAYIKEKYSNMKVNDLLDAATFMDPRFRTEYTDEVDKDGVIQRIIEEATEIVRSSQAHSNPSEHQDGHTEDTDPDTHPPPAKRHKLGGRVKLGAILKKPDASSRSQTPSDIAKYEIERYLQVPKVDEEENPLEWWKTNFVIFPTLSVMAKKYLCVCATSSPSERLFSTSGDVVGDNRASLKPEKVNMLVFLAKNL